jgi:hypothetical protein
VSSEGTTPPGQRVFDDFSDPVGRMLADRKSAADLLGQLRFNSQETLQR